VHLLTPWLFLEGSTPLRVIRLFLRKYCPYWSLPIISAEKLPSIHLSVFLLSLQKDCPSGQLCRKKFIEVYSGFFPDGNADEFCTHVFRTFDKDNSGIIDFNEFLLAINITSSGW
jgi:hypothetical protein